eukprot:TRINITY_DN5446_c0_g8_i1.p1 TRINITY_DN5446_c0_g8~~TRINITY_DN5446_c0_g8_i1.p1  ORF type:complete len:847 (-),score=191.30 TRINITY_DN5446_c0_g8_i1:125-2665(-)
MFGQNSLFGTNPQPNSVGGGQLFNQPGSTFSTAVSQAMPSTQGGLFQNPTSGGFPASGASPFGSPGLSGSLFGNPAPNAALNTGQSLFSGTGFNTQPQPGFGSLGMGTTSFGMSATQPSTGLFGSQPAQTGLGGTSLFGGGTSSFMPTGGQTQQTGMGGMGSSFGATSSAFGSFSGGLNTGISSGMSTGIMGGTGGIFGGTGIGGGFGGGANMLGGQQKGTAGVTLGRIADPNGDVFKSIMADEKLKNGDKSLEELRLEDYALRKAGQLQFNKSVTGFGAQTGGLNFGSTSTAFGSGTLLGSSAPKPTTSLFGQPVGGSTFGSPAPQSTSLFGNTSTALGTAQPSLFAQPAQNQPTGSLFSSNLPATGSLLGQKPASTSLFGAPAQPAANTGSLFGTANKPQGSLLGGTTGQTSLFGPSSGGLFGPNSGSNSALGGTTGQGSLFGGGSTQGSLFGGSTGQSLTFNPQVNSGIANQMVAELRPDYSDPYGVKSYLASTTASLKIGSKVSELVNRGHTPYDDEELIRMRPVPVDRTWKYNILTKVAQTNREPEAPARPLYLYGSNTMPRGNMYGVRDELMKSREQFKRLELVEREALSRSSQVERRSLREKSQNSILLNIAITIDNQESVITATASKSQTLSSLKEKVLKNLNKIYVIDQTKKYRFLNKEQVLNDSYTVEEAKLKNESRIRLVMDQEEEEVEIESESDSEEIEEPILKLAAPELIPKPPKEGYRISPEFALLCRMTEEQLRNVKDFSIENENGRIEFKGKVDLTGENLKENVIIGHRQVVVYPKDSDKPSVGKKLNQPAIITLFDCHPSNSSVSSDEFRKKLLKICEKQNVSSLLTVG